MNIEERAEQLIGDFKEQMKSACDEVLSNAYADILPHVESDTMANVDYRTQQAIDSLISGHFEHESDGESVTIKMVDGVDFRVRMTSYQYDRIRKSLLEVMPKCPKDLEIENLKSQLAEAYKRY